MAKVTTFKKNLLRRVIDPLEGKEIKPGSTKTLLDTLSKFLRKSMLDKISKGRSPVSRETFKSLDKSYAGDFKKGNRLPNLKIKDKMLKAMTVSKTRENKISIEIKGLQAEKMDGHSKLTGRKNATLKEKRRVIPAREQKFAQDILRGMNNLIAKKVV